MIDGLDIATLIAGINAVIALIGGIIATYKHVKARNYKIAFDSASAVGEELIGAINEFKILSDGKDERKLTMKTLGSRLERRGLKEKVDQLVDTMGFDNKA